MPLAPQITAGQRGDSLSFPETVDQAVLSVNEAIVPRAGFAFFVMSK